METCYGVVDIAIMSFLLVLPFYRSEVQSLYSACDQPCKTGVTFAVLFAGRRRGGNGIAAREHIMLS